MDTTYLLFGYRGARYGLDVRAVREIFWLPELSPIEELPPSIAGVFNLRGRIVPVMDLGLRFGHTQVPYSLGDRVIVLDHNEARVGLVANELYDVLTLPPDMIEPVQRYQGAGGQAQFITGEAKLDDGLATLLDVDALLQSAPHPELLSRQAPHGVAQTLLPLFGQLAPGEAQTLQRRALSLAEIHVTEGSAGLEGFAVIRLDNELFALGLDTVREFTHLRGVTPIPCCPPHIVGNMNLRGDILMLLDIRPALGMAMAGAQGEVVVVKMGELVLGLPTTEVVNVVQIAPADIGPVPVASDHAGKAYCKGIATVNGHAIGILDLAKIMASRELQVLQAVT